MDCDTCVNAFSHGGICRERKNNCLFYKNDIRGKLISKTFTFEMGCGADTKIIKKGEKIALEDNDVPFEATVLKILQINLEKMLCTIQCEYYENERILSREQKKNRFQVVK